MCIEVSVIIYICDFKTNGSIFESFPCEKFFGLHGDTNPRPLPYRGGRNLSHGKLSKIDPLVLKSH